MKNLLFLLLLAPLVASAGWINKAGEPLPDSGARKATGSFGANLLFVSDENELQKRWSTPSANVEVKTTDKVALNRAISAFVVFSGCKPDERGNCNVSMRFRVLQPDGKVYAETPAMEVWHDKPAPPGKSLELSVQYLRLLLEAKDPLGKYIISSQVRDDNTGSVLQLQAPFTAIKTK